MELQELLNKLPKLKPNRNYWFVRTNGGDLYDQFLQNGYVAIGWDKISLGDIAKSKTGNNTGIKVLKEIVKNKYQDENRPGHSASQLFKFAYEIKKDDIVIIPSQGSREISFGEILKTPAYIETNTNYFQKRKSVKWLETTTRDNLDPNLFKLMFSHHTISEAGLYEDYIDKEINSFFIKGQRAHLVLGVQETNDIKARDLFEMGTLSLDLLDEFAKSHNVNVDSQNINVKLNVQSPGQIELSGLDMGGIVILALIFLFIVGGGAEISFGEKFKLNLKTDGIIEKVRMFIKSGTENKIKKEILKKHLRDLKIKDPDELLKILKQIENE